MKEFNWKEFLKKHPFCWSLKGTEVDQLLQEETSKERNFPAGGLIMKEGEVGDSVFLIGSGSVQILLFSEDGLEIPLKRLERGEFFGEMAILENRPRAATVKAIEDSTLLEINGQEFLKLLMEHPEIEFKLLLTVSDRLRDLNKQVIGANLKQIDEKLRSLNMRLDVELKTVDASLKASQAFFDQTKLRTDEIINSAERSRTRLTVTASAAATIIGTILVILGWFGYKEFKDVNEIATNAMDHAVSASVEAVSASKEAMSASKEAVNTVAELRTLQDTIEGIRTRLREDLIEAFVKALALEDIPDVIKNYEYLKDLDPSRVEYSVHLINIREAIIKNSSTGNYTDIILDILVDAKVSKKLNDALSAYLLLLTNASLIDSERFSNGETFGSVRSDFEKYLNENKKYLDENKIARLELAQALSDVVDLEKLELLFKGKDEEKTKKFQLVKKVVDPYL